jgi:hypothetical protein
MNQYFSLLLPYMIRDFKFFSDNDEEWLPEGYINLEGREMASWMWDIYVTPTNVRYDLITVESNGIIEFLDSFHPQVIVGIHSIVGPNGVEHNGENEGNGWGFNIQTDPITITYLRYSGYEIE